MYSRVFIDLDIKQELPKLTSFLGLIDIKKNGKIIIRNSVLENIDMLTEEELIFVLKNLKRYISPIVTSQYIPSINKIKILSQLAPEFKVRFITEKAGTNPIVPITCKEFFEGEKFFSEIQKGIQEDWSELQRYKYLYNRICQTLSYDLNTLEFGQYNYIHERYSRNIFTAMAKNWGICASFAASFDYLCYREGLESCVLSEEDHDYVMLETLERGDLLTDPTLDSVRLKFGMKSKNFGVSKKQFVENGHNLEQTEASEYKFDELSEDEITQLDLQTGYLDKFGGKYTDDYISSIADNLEGSNILEKTKSFFDRIRRLRYVGRPSIYDFETIIKFILSKSKDREFADSIKIYSFISENTQELPRKIAVEVNGKNECVQYYVFENDLQSFQRVSRIESLEEQCQEK